METVIRASIVFVFIWAGFRILGKRELTKMTPFELTMLLLIPQFFSRALTREDFSLTNAIVGASTFLSLVFLTSVASHRSRRIARIMRAQPTILVQHGEFIETNMNQERIDPAEVFSAMRRHGLFRLDQVQWAVLEATGQIAIVPIPELLRMPIPQRVG